MGFEVEFDRKGEGRERLIEFRRPTDKNGGANSRPSRPSRPSERGSGGHTDSTDSTDSKMQAHSYGNDPVPSAEEMGVEDLES
jgi:hypothetical protein